MRYALRNQDKIRAWYDINGDEMLDRMKKSLDKAFHDHPDIMEIAERWQGEPYPIILISDVTSTDFQIAFYLVKKTYDVWTVAFKEFLS